MIKKIYCNFWGQNKRQKYLNVALISIENHLYKVYIKSGNLSVKLDNTSILIYPKVKSSTYTFFEYKIT